MFAAIVYIKISCSIKSIFCALIKLLTFCVSKSLEYHKQVMAKITSILFLSLLFSLQNIYSQQSQPNILIVIADDMGVDVTNGYQTNGTMPTTPTLDSLRANGITYKNNWSAPTCSPTRASIMSGKYGINTGLMSVPGNLNVADSSVFYMIDQLTDDAYSNAVFGKWHISSPVDYNHPSQHSVDHYEGLFTGAISDYYSWNKVTNGSVSTVDEYLTTHLTNSAIDWVGNQDQPWILWMAHVAPHAPFHIPPTDLFTTPSTNGQLNKYIAAIEAMDHEIGRLINSMDEETLNNTIIIFIGDNGTPAQVVQYFDSDHAKGSLYEGGIRVPMIISGKGVSRINEEEEGLTHVSDIYATVLELTGNQLSGGMHNSLSLKPSFTCSDMIDREFLYTDYEDGNVESWAIRNSQYKLIEDENGNQKFYDVVADLQEQNNLISSLTEAQQTVFTALEDEASDIRSGWSCNDGIQNGAETTIDDCDDTCTTDNSTSTDNIGCCEIPVNPSVYYEFIENGDRHIYTNDFPNHEYCYNPNLVPAETYYDFAIDLNPSFAADTSLMVTANGRPDGYFGVAKNGVIFAPAPAVPFIFENPNTGQYNWDWVFEATNNQGSGMGLVSLDCASAHTGPQGYHYHGNMFQYLETMMPGITTTLTPPAEPIHIGWAADGFPILYRFGPDADGNIKELQPSFQLRSGLRPGNGITEPCGPYNGKYTRDYEYICGKGELDECNGMHQSVTLSTAEGETTFDYFYVVTASFPQISRCLLGTPSLDFKNSAPDLTGIDADDDGFLEAYDCDDTNPLINPLAEEVIGNGIDENCDGDAPLCTAIVSLLTDSGVSTLRDAVDCISTGDTIYIDSDIAMDTIVLNASIEIMKEVYIVPNENNSIVIKVLGGGPIFNVATNGILHLDNTMLISGTSANGSAIVNAGNIVLHNVVVDINTANTNPNSLILNTGYMSIDGDTNLKKQ